jgi:molecular chaperone DnaK
MALRRQRLSQRRKAVEFTHESLAARRGVERSTVVRWEAGDTEPLSSIRPHVARALQGSIDQLAEPLTKSEKDDTMRACLADTEGIIPVLLPEVQSEVWLGRAEFENLVRPRVAETVEALRSTGVVSEDLDVRLLVGRSSQVPLVAQPVSAEPGRPVVDADPEAAIALGAARSGFAADLVRPADIDTAGADVGPDTPVPTTGEPGGFAGSDVPEPAQTQVPPRPSLTAISLDVEPTDVQGRRGRSRRFKRFAAAGVLVLVGGAASVPLITSPSGSIAPAAAGNPAPTVPVAAIPAPNADGSNGISRRSEDATGAPAAAPNKPADGSAPPVAAAVPVRHTRSDNRTTGRPKSPASMRTHSPPRTPAIPAEAYAWYQKALSPSDQRRTRLRPEPPQYP